MRTSSPHGRVTLSIGAAALCFGLVAGCNRASEPAPAAPPAPAPVVAPTAAIATPSAVAAAPLEAAPAAAPAAAAAAPTAAAAAPAPGSPAHFGAPLSAAPAVDVKTVLADAGKYDGKEVKLTGKVSGACQKKGCWMTLNSGEPGATSVRISFKDYGFFVPKDCMGKTAIVEGDFKMTTLSAAEAQHYAEDAAKPGTTPKKVTEAQKTYAMVAKGVELL